MTNPAVIEQQPSNSNISITDEQFEKFFSSGGNEAIEDVNEKPNRLEKFENDEIDLKSPEKIDAVKEVKEQLASKPEAQEQDNKELISYKAAVKEERERRQELQRQFAEQQNKISKMEERFQQFIQEKQNPQPKIPTFEEDPLEALRIQQEQIRNVQHQQLMADQQRRQYEQIQGAHNEFIKKYSQDAIIFAKDTPDFKDAYNYLVENRIKEHMEAGFSHEQATQLLREDEMAIASKAYQDGVNPADRLYRLAKLRGYNNKPIDAPQVDTKKSDSIEKFKQIEKGIQASQSLSGSGGKVDEGLTLRRLADMDDADFAKLTPAQWKKALAGS